MKSSPTGAPTSRPKKVVVTSSPSGSETDDLQDGVKLHVDSTVGRRNERGRVGAAVRRRPVRRTGEDERCTVGERSFHRRSGRVAVDRRAGSFIHTPPGDEPGPRRTVPHRGLDLGFRTSDIPDPSLVDDAVEGPCRRRRDVNGRSERGVLDAVESRRIGRRMQCRRVHH